MSCTFTVLCTGRRPAELESSAHESTRPRDLLSAIARLEAASVHAFVRLARELAHHRAPSSLVARAREAARDEVRHARATHALAVRFGADSTSAPRIESRSRRPPALVEILVENEVEGCVRETFGALLAHVQALRATDPVVRRTMAQIAVDESRHAALAWEIQAWGRSRLSKAERKRIDAARQCAVQTLIDEIQRSPAEVEGDELGLVGAIEARALAASLEEHVWSDEPNVAA